MREQRLRFLSELALAVQPLGDAADIMVTTARLLGQLLAVNRCAYAEVEADQNHFNLTGDYNDGVASIVGRYPFAAFGADCLERMRTDRPYVVHDVDADPRIGADDLPAYRATAIRAVICLPLHKEGRLVAAMAVHQAVPRTWTAGELELVQLVVNRCWESLERARAVRALKLTADRLSLAMSAAQLGDWTWHVDDGVIEVSPQAARLFGADPHAGALPWNTLRDRIDPCDLEAVLQAQRDCLALGQRYEVEHRVLHEGGAVAWLAASGIVLPGPDQKARAIVGVVGDITERKRMQDELHRRAQQLADEDRRKDEFLATLAHELRNPLAPLRSALDMLRRGQPTPDDRQRAETMMSRQVDQMTRLVDELIDRSRISNGTLALHLGEVALGAIVELAQETVAPALAARGQRLVVAGPPPELRVRVDGTRVSQVLMNLLHNASKYSEPGKTVWLDVRADGTGVLLEVRDEGIGIAPDFLPQVFDMFVQSPRARAMSGSGLGIGLALAKRLVELHGGRLHVSSPGIGQGSSFTVQLPGVLAATAPAANALPAAASGAQPLSVLVIDDNADAAESMAMLVATMGHRTATAIGGDAGLALLHARPFDVAFVDIGMPGRDGYEVARALRDDRALSAITLIALTGWGTEVDRRRAFDAGFDHHLTKPASADAVHGVLLAAAAGPAGGATARRAP